MVMDPGAELVKVHQFGTNVIRNSKHPNLNNRKHNNGSDLNKGIKQTTKATKF